MATDEPTRRGLDRIPKQLQDEKLRFILVKRKSKIPIEQKWQIKKHYKHNDTKLLDWLAKGENYGIVCGERSNNLAVIDCDHNFTSDVAKQKLPETLIIKTGSGKIHLYFFCYDLNHKIILDDDPGGNHYGEVQFTGQQVIGPSSIHPNGGKYTVLVDNPIATVTRQQILDALQDCLKKESKVETKVDWDKKEKEKNIDVDITKIQKISKLKSISTDEYQGSHPVHGSKTGKNFVVNVKDNLWHCFRCQSGGGGLSLIAVLEGVIDCSEAKHGVLKGKKFRQLIKIANEKYKLNITLPKTTPKINLFVDKGEEIVVWLYSKNALKLTNGDKIVYPYTITNKTWYSSEWYRRKIQKKIQNSYSINEALAGELADTVTTQAGIRLAGMTKETPMSDETQDILNTIEDVDITRSEDTNMYTIYMDGKRLRLTDSHLYDGPRTFCIQYLNRFLKKIVISLEDWDQHFLPLILEKAKLANGEEKIESNADIVVHKFIKYVHGRQCFDWENINSRLGHETAVYYDGTYEAVRISPQFITNFFEKERIQLKYKVSKEMFDSHIRDFLVRKRITGKVAGIEKTFRMFKPEKLEISSKDIVKTSEPTEKIPHILDFNKFDKEDGGAS